MAALCQGLQGIDRWPFSVALPESRREFLQAYRAHLQQRDGQADVQALTLSPGEEQLQQHRRQAATFPA